MHPDDDPSFDEDPVDAIATAWERERPGMATDGIRIVTRIWQLAKIFGDTRRQTVTAEGVDLATLDLLSTLRRAGPPYQMTTRELTQRSMVTAGAISQRLARAERDALVTRSRVTGQHAVMVTLSDAGHRQVEQLIDLVAETDSRLLTGLDPGQCRELDLLLKRLLADVQQQHGLRGVSHVGEG